MPHLWYEAKRQRQACQTRNDEDFSATEETERSQPVRALHGEGDYGAGYEDAGTASGHEVGDFKGYGRYGKAWGEDRRR